MNTHPLHRTVALLLSLASLIACVAAPTPAPTPDQNVALINKEGGDERLRALALRVISPYSDGTQNPNSLQTPEIVVGGIPDNLPLDLPQPPKATLLGSLRPNTTFYETQIFFDVEDTSVSIIDFYIKSLKLQGFSIWTPNPPFINNDPHLDGVVLCRTDIKPTEVDISTATIPDKPVQLRIDIRTNPQAAPCFWPQSVFPGPFSAAMMPKLKMPENAIAGTDLHLIGSSGGAASNNQSSQSLQIYTELSVSEVADTYAQQLLSAGWAKAKETNTDEVAWSRWTKADQFDGEWDGVLLVTGGPIEARERFVVFNIELK
jgi:hypothetical protein